MSDQTIYQFDVKKLNGETISLSDYKGKVLLIVNTASQCGFTPQLKSLAELKDQFPGQDFEILAFPANDFGQQEPLNGEAIGQFCENYGANYPVFDKIAVRGGETHPLYKFFADKKLNGKFNSVPRWNFHKILVDKTGHVADYYFPQTKPTSFWVKRKIGRLLSKK